MLLELKKAFLDLEVPIYKTAIRAGVNPNKASKIIHELAKATPQERASLSRVLNRPAAELFPDEGVVNV